MKARSHDIVTVTDRRWQTHNGTWPGCDNLVSRSSVTQTTGKTIGPSTREPGAREADVAFVADDEAVTRVRPTRKIDRASPVREMS